MTDRENTLFKILIITLIGSGAALIALRSAGDYYRDQLWIATQAALPFHHAKQVQPGKGLAGDTQATSTATSTKINLK